MALREWKLLGSTLTLAAWIAAAADANDLSPDEEVIFFETAVPFDPATSRTLLDIHGWIFEPESDSITRRTALSGIARVCGFSAEEEATEIFRKRAGLFLVDNERNQRLVVRCGKREIALPVSQSNGHIRGQISLLNDELKRVSNEPDALQRLDFELVAPAGDLRKILGRVHLLRHSGWSVISDIDDTIKASNVLDRKELLRNTFLREFEAVPGMASQYAKWRDDGAAFHYVSGSPWQLYPALHPFVVDQGFPSGAWHLRYCRIQDGSAAELLQTPEGYKIAAIEEILRAFPRRRFILVGDTGEKDPEVYGELARRYPDQIRLIALRNFTNEAIDGARMRTALSAVSGEKVLLFQQPSELPSLTGIK